MPGAVLDVNVHFSIFTLDEDAAKIYADGVALQTDTTAQVVVVTVESLDGKPIEEYALEIGRRWGVGDQEKNNGVVILFSKNDREIYVAVGYGLEGALPDVKTGRIIDYYGLPHFSEDNFSTGIVGIYNAIVNETYFEYDMQPQEDYVPVELLPDTSTETGSVGRVVVSWLVLLVLVAIYIAIFGRRGGLFLFGSPRFFVGGHHFHGGGFGGSSGGFGGFSGGGGSFGGGGAGRKF